MDSKELEKKIIEVLKEVYDPEIPVNIWDLGLIYRLDVDEQHCVDIDMTLTAPNCPLADSIVHDVREKIKSVDHVSSVMVNLVFDPPWNMELMTEEAKLELGFL